MVDTTTHEEAMEELAAIMSQLSGTTVDESVYRPILALGETTFDRFLDAKHQSDSSNAIRV